MCYLHFQVCIFINNIPNIPIFVTPSFCSLMATKLGPEGGIAIAEALKINTTITTIE
jgi:hypothetical protein